MKPIIKYRGGKSKEMKNFLQFIPRDYKTCPQAICTFPIR